MWVEKDGIKFFNRGHVLIECTDSMRGALPQTRKALTDELDKNHHLRPSKRAIKKFNEITTLDENFWKNYEKQCGRRV